MKLLKQIREHIIPIISILLAIASFFSGRWIESENFKLDREKFNAQQENYDREIDQKTQEIIRLKDQHQKDLQFKYVDLLTQNLNVENLFKAEIIIHLIEDPEVQTKFSSFTQNILSKNKNINAQTKKVIRGNLANTSYNARVQIENMNNIQADSIISKSIKNPNKISSADTVLLEKFDKKENNVINSKYSVYQEFLTLLKQFKNESKITNEQLTKYIDLHVEIINTYADAHLKNLMDELL